MSFLLLNGWRLPALNDSPSQSFDQLGEFAPGMLNRPTRGRRALPASWKAQMSVMIHEDADTLEALVTGQGHHFPCDVDAFSDAGLGPEAGGAYTVPIRTSSAGMFGIGYLNVSTSIVWDPRLPGTWMVAYWRNVAATPEHIAVRSDGAKWLNGVRADATATTELTVSSGAVALTTGQYDDVVILPVKACATFIAALYRWTSGKEIQWHVPFDGFDAEVLNRGVALATSTGTTFLANGQIGKARQFDGAEVTQYTGAKTQAFGASELSFEFWANRDSGLTEGVPEAVVMLRSSGLSAGLRLFMNTSGADAGRFEAFLWTASGKVRTLLSIGAVPTNTWHHMVVTWTQASGVLKIYLNGTDSGQVLASFPGSAVANDVGVGTFLGNNLAGTAAFGGYLDDVRMYRRALTSNEVLDHWQAGRHNIRPPVLQAFSKLPALEIDGGIVGWRQTTVLGDAGDAPLQQHGGSVNGSSGWKNNSRMPNVVLDERQQFEPAGGIPLPHAGLILSEKNDSAGAIRMLGGFANGTRTNGAYVAGPFDFGRAYSPPGPPAGQIDLSATIAGAMGGKRYLTVLAWVRRNASGVQHTVLCQERAVASVKVRLDVTAGNLVRFGGRASAADAAEVLRSSVVTFLDLNSWHLVGGIIDLASNRIATVFDTTVNEGVATFAATAFSTGSAGVHRIGLDNGGANRWNGAIASTWWWFRRLSVGEITDIYNAGRSGIFY